MVYKNQNYMTNRKIKEEVDTFQKDYVDPNLEPDSGSPIETPNNSEPNNGETPTPDNGETPTPDNGETPNPDNGETPNPNNEGTPTIE